MKQFIQKFNNLIKKTIFKVKNKTNNKSQISNFNKYLITFISLLFFYLFYLSIPVLYDKTQVQIDIENQLLKEFKINFSISSNISYRILPSPHFLIKESKIFKKDGDTSVSLADIKNLKVFVSQKNFFDKNNIVLRYIKINKANFSLLNSDFKLLKNSSNSKFSKKRIEINKSNIFFKDRLNKTITIIKISKAFLFLDNDRSLNLFNLKGKIFNIPFSFDYKKKFVYPKREVINIIAKKLKLNIFDMYNIEENNLHDGKNITTFLNSTVSTDYKIKNDLIIFNSSKSDKNNNKIDYNGKLSIDPFDLNLNINIDDHNLSKIFDINSILKELIKSKLLFNENISANTSITLASNSKKEIFQKSKINFVIMNGKISFDKTKLINEKIGSIELVNSNLLFLDNNLTLNTDIIIDIDNADELYSLLQTNKKSRKFIKNILINLNYDFSTNQIKFNNMKIENKEVSNESLKIIDDFGSSGFNNLIKNRRLLNKFFETYEG